MGLYSLFSSFRLHAIISDGRVEAMEATEAVIEDTVETRMDITKYTGTVDFNSLPTIQFLLEYE